MDRRAVFSSALACLLLSSCATVPTLTDTPRKPLVSIEEPEEPEAAAETSPHAAVTGSVPIETSLGEWRSIGPKNFGGKVYDVAVHPTDKDTVYAAYCSGGGLWKTADGGATWAQLTDITKYNGIGSVAIATSNPSIVVAGLGSPASQHNTANGLIRSTDGGATWTEIGPTDEGDYVRTIVDPDDPNIIYTATETALYETIDAGAHWSTLRTYTGTITVWKDMPELVMNPANSSELLLAQKSIGLVKTPDGGTTWSAAVDPNPSHIDWTVMAYAPSDPLTIYAERPTGSGSNVQTYKSTDGGATWTEQALLTDAPMQSRFDSTMAVDPNDPTHVFIGNSFFYDSADSLVTAEGDYGMAHPDHGRIVYAPSDSTTIYDGNDGGLWRSTNNGQSFSQIDTGVHTSIAYGFDVDATTGRVAMSPQDWGCFLYTGDPRSWYSATGGEYDDYAISPWDPNVMFVGYKPRYRSLDAGGTWTNVDPDSANDRPRRFPFQFDAADPNTVYTSVNHLYKSTDLGTTWTQLTPAAAPLDFSTLTSGIAWFEVSSKDPMIIYTTSALGLVVTTDGGAT